MLPGSCERRKRGSWPYSIACRRSEEMRQLAGQGRKQVPGELYFRYYDTFGIPRDTVRELAGRAGLGLDEEAFEQYCRVKYKKLYDHIIRMIDQLVKS